LFKGVNEPEQLELIFRTMGHPTDHSWPEFKEILASKNLQIHAKHVSSKLSERFAEVNRANVNGTV